MCVCHFGATEPPNGSVHSMNHNVTHGEDTVGVIYPGVLVPTPLPGYTTQILPNRSFTRPWYQVSHSSGVEGGISDTDTDTTSLLEDHDED